MSVTCLSPINVCGQMLQNEYGTVCLFSTQNVYSSFYNNINDNAKWLSIKLDLLSNNGYLRLTDGVVGVHKTKKVGNHCPNTPQPIPWSQYIKRMSAYMWPLQTHHLAIAWSRLFIFILITWTWTDERSKPRAIYLVHIFVSSITSQAVNHTKLGTGNV